jgi:hypothetical protein
VLGVSQHSTRFGFDLPDDFPLNTLEIVHAKVSDGPGSIRENDEALWRHWAGGCNGTMYRFTDAAAVSDQWVASSAAGLSPPPDERLKQEIALFSFFTSALSSLECLAYGLGAIGEALRPAFPVTSAPKRITFPFVAATFSNEFPNEQLGSVLTAAGGSPEMQALRATRNILAHRETPGRTHSGTLTSTPGGGHEVEAPTLWMGTVLGPTTTSAPRQWVAETLESVLQAAEVFTRNHL